MLQFVQIAKVVDLALMVHPVVLLVVLDNTVDKSHLAALIVVLVNLVVMLLLLAVYVPADVTTISTNKNLSMTVHLVQWDSTTTRTAKL